MTTLRQVLSVTVGVGVALLAASEVLTLLMAMAWLDPGGVPAWAWAVWVARAALYGAAAYGWLADRRWGAPWVAVAGLQVLIVEASPLGAWSFEAEGRWTFGALMAVVGTLRAWRRFTTPTGS